MSEILYESDWLGSDPVYYNTITGRASLDINDVIELETMEIDHTGLAAFLDHGFSVFQRTPVRDVRILPPDSRLLRRADGSLRVEALPDRLEERLGGRWTEGDVLDLLHAFVREAERSSSGPIVVPTSGGYDSRLLNLMVDDRTRVRAFSYGTSEPQADSLEVRRARALAETLAIRWERVPLGLFHIYFDEWDRLFGPAIHAHGMYHMEFYAHVRRAVAAPALLLTGLAGDWIAGDSDNLTTPITSPAEVKARVYSRLLHADSSMAWVGPEEDLYAQYLETHRDRLATWELRLVELTRHRMGLLHYLKKVPRVYGFDPVAPFIDPEVAAAMLSLPPERRWKRRWVMDHFKQRGVALEGISGSTWNTLNLQAMQLIPPEPLDVGVLREVVRPEYVRWINRTLGWRGWWWDAYGRLLHAPGVDRARPQLKRWGLAPRRLEAYAAYLVLRPIERLLRRRDESRAKAG